MDLLAILNANAKAEQQSFLYYLHEEQCFHEAAFYELCACISSLSRTHPHDRAVSSQIAFLYGQVLRHLIAHFDPNDLSRISHFPADYNETLAVLEHAVMKYFNR